MILNIENTAAELETAAILGLSELVKAIEKKLDVSVAAPVAVVGPVTGGVAEEQTEFTVGLIATDDQKVKVIKVAREVTGLGLKETKAVIDGAPASVKEGASKEEAETLEVTLEEVDTLVIVK